MFRPTYNPYAPSAPPQQNNGTQPPQQFQPQQPAQGAQPYPPYQGQFSAPPYPGYPGYPPYPNQPNAHAPYPAYPGYPGYPGYPYHPGYAPYGYGYPFQKPRRDGYLKGMNITALVCSILAIIGGLIALALALGVALLPHNPNLPESNYFSSMLQFIAFASAGLLGGGFTLYHSIRSLIRRPSAAMKMPVFWIFLILYVIVLGIGFALQSSGNAVTYTGLSIFLIALAALFPALTLLALGVRRLRFPSWPTSWRRFTVALTSGATSGIGIALLLELVLSIAVIGGTQLTNTQNCLSDPTSSACQNLSFNVAFIIIAIIGPVVEETVKPLAVVAFIGRVRSASEAFVLGMACGIGFALVETVGYIGLGYQDWLSVALERTGASLLHGFGAGMVALGWYYLFHAKNYRVLRFIGCFAYAIFQHFVWNATAILSLLPGPVGSTINSWNINLGFTTLPFVELLNIIEAILILAFFIYITGRIKEKPASPPPRSPQPSGSGNTPVFAHS